MQAHRQGRNTQKQSRALIDESASGFRLQNTAKNSKSVAVFTGSERLKTNRRGVISFEVQDRERQQKPHSTPRNPQGSRKTAKVIFFQTMHGEKQQRLRRFYGG